MSFAVPTNQAVSFTVYRQAVALETRLPDDFLKIHAYRLDRAFNAGEPIWMISAELKMVHDTAPTWRPTKSPRALAKRVFKEINDGTMSALKGC